MDVVLVANVAPKTFKRYVDDFHARFDTCEEMVKFHQILNEQDERIQYTIENEVDGGIAFLDEKLQIIEMVNTSFRSTVKTQLQMYR